MIDGNGHTITGEADNDGFLVKSSNVTFQNVHFRNFKIAIFLASEKDLSDVGIDGCTFQNDRLYDVLAGAIESNSRMQDIRIVNCDFYPQAMIPVVFSACFDLEGGKNLENCLLEHVLFLYFRIVGRNGEDQGEGLCVYCAADMSNMYNGSLNLLADYESHGIIQNCAVRDVQVLDSLFYQVGDCALGFCTASPGVNCIMENVVIRHNIIRQCLGAMGVGCADLMWGGECHGNIFRNAVIEDNQIYAAEFDKREPINAIGVNSSRIEWKSAKIYDNHVCNVIIRNNEIHGTDGGIVVEAMHALLDAPQPAVIADSSTRNVSIENNKFYDCRFPVKVFAANAEGRYDSLGGVAFVDDPDMEYSTLAERNSIDKIAIRGNYASGFEMFLIIAAAHVYGHVYAKDNTVGADVVVEDNMIRKGRLTFIHKYYITDEILMDDTVGTGNKSLCDVRFYFTGEE